MSKIPVLDDFLNQPNDENMIKCVQYCYDKNVDFEDSDLLRVFDISTRYLMRYKIGNLTEDDAKLLITYFSKKASNDYQLNENINISILSDKEYNEKYGDCSAVCVENDSTNEIFYSPKVVKQLTSNNTSTILRGMQTIYHEVIHCLQNNVIKKYGKHKDLMQPKLSMYIMTFESIVRNFDSKFYELNYSSLYKENHAELIGLREAINTIKEYNPKLYELYNTETIFEADEHYSQSINSSLVVFGVEDSHLKSMDAVVCLAVEDHPELLEQYPLLNLGFSKNGQKKDIIELIKDRRARMDNYTNIEDLNTLYNGICNEKNFVSGGLKGTKDEIIKLVDYLSNNDYDEFEFGLLVYRLNNKNITEQQRQDIIDSVINCDNKSNTENDKHIKS